MKESYIERVFVQKCKENGWWCIKLTGFNGIPDRQVIFPNGTVAFVELKAEGGRVREIQAVTIRQLIGMQHEAVILTGMTEVREWVISKGGTW